MYERARLGLVQPGNSLIAAQQEVSAKTSPLGEPRKLLKMGKGGQGLYDEASRW